MGRPTSTSRFPAREAPLPWLSLLMSPVRVELWLMRILFGLAVCVRTMNGSKVVVPPLATTVLIVAAAAFVPHQLFVTVAVALLLLRLLPLPPLVVFPANRLKLMVKEPVVPALAFPWEMPPPFPVAVLPVIVTLLSVVVQVDDKGQGEVGFE